MARPKLPGELTWPKLLGTTLAAVVTAWLAGRLGLGGTLTGVAIGSVIATFSAAFFTTTIDKSHQAVLVRTERGTVVEARGEQDVVIEDGGGTQILPAHAEEPDPMASPGGDTPSRWSQINWRAVAIASLVTMALTLGAISIYESAVGRTWGSNQPGTTLGNTVHGGPPAPVTATPTPTPTPTEEPSPTPTPSEEPTASATPTDTPTPTATPSPSATPTDCPTPTESPTDGTSPGTTNPDCPTPSPSASEDTGLLR